MAYGSVNVDKMTTSDGISSAGVYGFKNRLINGNFAIDQRNAGASVTATSNPFTLDRWRAITSQSAKFTVQQTPSATETGYATRVGAGFTNYLACTSSSAYSITSTDYFLLRQVIEGYNASDFAWGTSSAKTVTLSFWAYSSLTGTFGGSLQNDNQDTTYIFSYSIPTANTWTQISVTITGSTSGTWLKTNGAGIYVTFGLGVGSTLSGTAGSWLSGNYFSATGATSVVGTNGATFYITGTQLEVGSTATSFDYRPFGTELALCQRYLPAFNSIANTSYQTVASGFNSSTTLSYFSIPFQVPARTQPTGLTTANYNSFQIAYRASAQTATSLSFVDGSTVAARVSVGGSGLTAGDGVILLYQNGSSSVGQLLFTGCEL